ncbi:MAG: hypothetical protein RI911_526 [Candidatus Parcubacteria bacterium]|jgi:uncharacterized membrane protein
MLSRKHFKRIFDTTLIVKGVAAVVDIVAAVIIFTTHNEIVVLFFAKVTTFMTDFEGDGLISQYMSVQPGAISTFDIWFITGYLVFHGVLNLILVEGIWFRRQWAYTKAMRILLFFFVYQCVRLMFVWSYWLCIVTLYDLLIILLLHYEYAQEKKKKQNHQVQIK